MSTSEALQVDLPEIVLRLAGEAGQSSLARSAGQPGAQAAVDQHASELRDALGRGGRVITPAALACYAQGFTEAAIARGWWPPHRRALAKQDGWDGRDAESDLGPELDWQSLRLAAVCQLFIEAQGLGLDG